MVLTKKFIAGKLVNQANFLKLMAKNRRQTDAGLAERLYESGKRIDEANERISLSKDVTLMRSVSRL